MAVFEKYGRSIQLGCACSPEGLSCFFLGVGGLSCSNLLISTVVAGKLSGCVRDTTYRRFFHDHYSENVLDLRLFGSGLSSGLYGVDGYSGTWFLNALVSAPHVWSNHVTGNGDSSCAADGRLVAFLTHDDS